MMDEIKEKTKVAGSVDYAAGHDRKLADASSYLHSDHSLVEELVFAIKTGLDPGAKVLEVGCGGGHTAANLCRLGFEVTATDFSETALEQAARSYPDVDFQAADATDMAFPDSSFDGVVAVELIEHLADPRAHVREVHRVLHGRGTYFVKTPNRILHDYYYRKNPEVARWHPSVMSAGELRSLLVSEGFDTRFVRMRRLPAYQIDKALTKLGPLAGLAKPILRSAPLGWLPSAAQPSLICVAVKPGL